MKEIFQAELKSLIDLIQAIRSDELQAAADLIRKTPGKLIILGNGGSNGVASHMAEDYTNNFKPTLCFSDAAFMSCFANDFGWENAFQRWLQNFALPGDTLILISSSGASRNILNCAEWAIANGYPLISLSGFKPENPLRQLGDVRFYVESQSYKDVELMHAIILHTILEALIKSKTAQ
ncbi:phosphoheptose isomerase [bacterium (Candidatus Blackallbacteria) CG17_big_fil_post_rev_8_21_14_2_50_48_46]|uniref:Phosphoheptose isomerase n=1 Tax=bacterium (Candidatus Blackallbacteria) CG17_big_fil_post_rev_8_21_14_2_50_48_46 TaxID=2014261 RepID=A0A2M7GA87_9BACT|nr:MAG: phosphoheptose isomerase [bacterium (Candidatus Blackallbacteria) CG18_big_fil_WC_8_21_14_2_50_49_26]PIW19059.1 MAG: phosphoheptose isomerase [bacterium (Candidatus Blackallbacteria) CG17_big_fil_post_rev_8_21_14_2_50_48_46]PIW44574.1 MAG: phosphoheptose isomerase [bacterium (Candidatus Blackallbacteria) CG13_big_fil_rev_8_21_14_2_50_49_14]